MRKVLHIIAMGCFGVFCLLSGLNAASPTKEGDKDIVLSTMQQELQRAQSALAKQDPAPYFISYSVHDQDLAVAVGSQGSLINSINTRRRLADVVARVGTPVLDNSHGVNRRSAMDSGPLPLGDDPDAIARLLWQLTYREYRRASEAYLNAKTKNQVQAREEDTSADFSQGEAAQNHSDYGKSSFSPEQQKVFEEAVRRYSGYFRKYPYVYSSVAMIVAQNTRSRLVSTEGARVVTPNAVIRLAIEAETRAEDGMELMRVETFQAEDASHLPSGAEIESRVEKMAADLKALRSAPVAEPFDGPALLSGRAAAVFFHEVLGHRLEGQRQRGEEEGQTFTKKLNQQILPEFLSVIDDPTQRRMNDADLSGWYEYDDEGIPAAKVNLIENGILKNFLMSRMPIKGFDKSNGHGRAQPGLMATGRQGNLIVVSSRKAKDSELREKLIDEVKKQGKPYGLYFEDIQGGFTLTQRAMPQAFQVLPIRRC